MYYTMQAIVSGFTCAHEAFSVTCDFEMVPLVDSNCYGTGYYMIVKIPGSKFYVDVRYERTVDIEVLADRWIKNYFGENAREVVMYFGRNVREVIMEGGEK